MFQYQKGARDDIAIQVYWDVRFTQYFNSVLFAAILHSNIRPSPMVECLASTGVRMQATYTFIENSPCLGYWCLSIVDSHIID